MVFNSAVPKELLRDAEAFVANPRTKEPEYWTLLALQLCTHAYWVAIWSDVHFYIFSRGEGVYSKCMRFYTRILVLLYRSEWYARTGY